LRNAAQKVTGPHAYELLAALEAVIGVCIIGGVTLALGTELHAKEGILLRGIPPPR
jgi:hypothetical protein